MQKTLLFTLLFLFRLFVNAQSALTVVSLYEEQTFYLNGGARAAFGGQSRVAYKIDLPPNTTEWYYSISVEPNQSSGSGSINLLSQLTKAIDPSGITAIAVSNITTPTGSGVCDAYLFSENNFSAFLSKSDHFNFDYNNSRMNYRNGTVKITMRPDYIHSFYIGFRNPSASQGITIKFSAAAIVANGINRISNIQEEHETVIETSIWNKNEKNKIYYNLIHAMKKYSKKEDIVSVNEQKINEVATCFIDNLMSINKSTFMNMADYERERFIKTIIQNCYSDSPFPLSLFYNSIEISS